MSQQIIDAQAEEIARGIDREENMKNEFAKELSAQEKRFHIKCLRCRGSRL